MISAAFIILGIVRLPFQSPLIVLGDGRTTESERKFRDKKIPGLRKWESQYLNPGHSDYKALSFSHSAMFSWKPFNKELIVRLKTGAISQPLSGSVLGRWFE